MNKTNIEWVKNPDGSQGYTWNPITGCLNHDNGLCKGGGFPCYAYKLANGRLKQRYLANTAVYTGWDSSGMLDPFYPRFWEERLYEPFFRKIPSGIFVCDMSDLFGDAIPHGWISDVVEEIIPNSPHHRFYLLTKQPQNLIQFSPFPENCWVGVTVTNNLKFHEALFNLEIVVAPIRFISIEPLLGQIPMNEGKIERMIDTIDWLIIGACTGNMVDMAWLGGKYPELEIMPWGKKWTAQPRIEWVREIVEAADQAGIPVFLKDNLSPLLGQMTIDDKWVWAKDIGYGGLYRQELPNMTLVRSKW